MSNQPQQGLSAGALWALSWRAVVLFPIAAAGFCTAIAAVGGVLLLAAWTVAYAIMQEWLKSTLCASGLIIAYLLWRAVKPKTTAPFEVQSSHDQSRGGCLL